MYEAFYQLDKAPFSNIPDPALLFLSPQHQRALSVLKYALMARAGFCVITGDVGAGKTTLVRKLLSELNVPVDIGLVSNTQCDTFEEFLQWILLAFDLEYRGKEKVELYDTFVGHLISQFRKGCPVTLIIDEAQHLGPEYLEQLRMMSNVNTEKGQILQTILVGQPELWDLLHQPELEQFAQRISYDYFLSPLDSEELTRDYVQFRIEHSGGKKDLFENDTYKLIWKTAGGTPRLINLICDTALVFGYAEEKSTIGLDIIDQVIEDKKSSFNSNRNKPTKNSETTSAANPVEKKTRPLREKRNVKTAELTTIERAALKLKNVRS